MILAYLKTLNFITSIHTLIDKLYQLFSTLLATVYNIVDSHLSESQLHLSFHIKILLIRKCIQLPLVEV